MPARRMRTRRIQAGGRLEAAGSAAAAARQPAAQPARPAGLQPQTAKKPRRGRRAGRLPFGRTGCGASPLPSAQRRPDPPSPFCRNTADASGLCPIPDLSQRPSAETDTNCQTPWSVTPWSLTPWWHAPKTRDAPRSRPDSISDRPPAPINDWRVPGLRPPPPNPRMLGHPRITGNPIARPAQQGKARCEQQKRPQRMRCRPPQMLRTVASAVSRLRHRCRGRFFCYADLRGMAGLQSVANRRQ
jgi:hypothetical protein